MYQDDEVDVQTLYQELNVLFFEGLLPADYQIVFVPIEELTPAGDEAGEHDGVLRVIKLTEPLRNRPQALRRLLIHEMVHAAEGDEHGEAFFNRLVDIARQGEDWAWNEARDYHSCIVRTLIHLWRNFPVTLKQELDPRRSCRCEACKGWQQRGCPSDEELEQWRPWEPPGAPVHPYADWIENRAFELMHNDEDTDFDSALDQARLEAESF